MPTNYMDGIAVSEHEVSKNVGSDPVWKYSGLLPSVVLALSRLDKTSSGLLM